MAITQIPAQETKPSTGRYSIGETLYGVAFTYEGKNFASISPPMIWDDQMPKAFHFIQLEVTEQHKVLWDYDEPTAEKKYDGYKLKSSTGPLSRTSSARSADGLPKSGRAPNSGRHSRHSHPERGVHCLFLPSQSAGSGDRLRYR